MQYYVQDASNSQVRRAQVSTFTGFLFHFFSVQVHAKSIPKLNSSLLCDKLVTVGLMPHLHDHCLSVLSLNCDKTGTILSKDET